MKTNYMGLWKQERAGWYCSKAFTRKQLQELPARCRLVLRYNKYHKPQENNTPKFVFTFADAESSQNLCDIQQLEDMSFSDLVEQLKEIRRYANQLDDDGYYTESEKWIIYQRIYKIANDMIEKFDS